MKKVFHDEWREFFEAWVALTDARQLEGDELAAFRVMCEGQAAHHPSAALRMLFALAAVRRVITVRLARSLAPFVEKPSSIFS